MGPDVDLADEAWQGNLTLGDLLSSAGVNPTDVLVIRHSFKPDGLPSHQDLTADNVIAYTRRQGLAGGKFPVKPPWLWLVFLADGGHRTRFYGAYENTGEADAERSATNRFYNLVESDLLKRLDRRLVIEWSRDSINWAKSGRKASSFPVIEISDPGAVPFPGFDRVAVTYAELQDVMNDARYDSWRTALGAVQGIYLIADRSTGKLYVGKADGSERILGRWRQYADTGHGGNAALREALGVDPERAQHFTWSLLRVFGSNTTPDEVDAAESHFKETLLTRKYGFNRN